MKKIWLLALCSFFTILLSCDKSDTNCSVEFTNQGTIYDYGNPALDGCGWIINITDSIFSPVNLNEKYQKDGLSVEIRYRILSTKTNCAWRKNAYTQIEILKISQP